MIVKLIYREVELGDAWRTYFAAMEDVEIIGDDICDVDRNVAPAVDALEGVDEPSGFYDRSYIGRLPVHPFSRR